MKNTHHSPLTTRHSLNPKGFKNGFSLIIAIVILIIVSTLMALMISLTTTTVKQTSDIYLKEQTELLSRSAAEYALLAISGHDHDGLNNCVEKINIKFPNNANPTHEANVTLRYIGDTLPAGCPQIVGATDINTTESNMTVVMDVVAYVADANLSPEPIRFHKRTIQKP